ncbi:MAG TPA: ABC transporter permease, partial [Opitutaceae bacterium]|nr:ABC transporter permease [Opitutaceae bacterium]
MKRLNAWLDGFGSALVLAVRSFASLPTAPRIIRRVVEHTFVGGYTTLPIVSILSFFIGGVLALQSGISMQDFGAKQFIGTLVGESIVRELGPVMVAILLAGRVGSAVTAEIASMKVYQEVDAL